MLKNSDSGLSRLFPNGKIIGDFQIKTTVISIKKNIDRNIQKKTNRRKKWLTQKCFGCALDAQ